MAKNERIIAQDLAEIKGAIQDQDYSRLDELKKILKREMRRYPVKPDVMGKLEIISNYSNEMKIQQTDQLVINEINELIEILTLHR